MSSAVVQEKQRVMQNTLQNISEAVEAIKNDAPQNFPVAASVGDGVRQGDIYIQKLEDDAIDDLPFFYEKQSLGTTSFQLAEGNNKGSRHCLEPVEGAEIWALNQTTLNIMGGRSRLVDADTRNKLRVKFTALASDLAKEEFERRGDSESPKNPTKLTDLITDITNTILEASVYAGPVLRLAKGGVISHPEHGDWIMPPGVYGISFQRTMANDQKLRRVYD